MATQAQVSNERDTPREKRTTTKIEDSVLNQTWEPPTRPVSANEVVDSMDRLYKRFRLVPISAEHACGHTYMVRKNGRKHNDIIAAEESQETHPRDIGNCSVCWKLNNTPYVLRPAACEIVNMYQTISNSAERSALDEHVMRVYYTWLYHEQFERRRHRSRYQDA